MPLKLNRDYCERLARKRTRHKTHSIFIKPLRSSPGVVFPVWKFNSEHITLRGVSVPIICNRTTVPGYGSASSFGEESSLSWRFASLVQELSSFEWQTVCIENKHPFACSFPLSLYLSRSLCIIFTLNLNIRGTTGGLFRCAGTRVL